VIHDHLQQGPFHFADDHLKDVAGFMAIEIIKIGPEVNPSHTARW